MRIVSYLLESMLECHKKSDRYTILDVYKGANHVLVFHGQNISIVAKINQIWVEETPVNKNPLVPRYHDL